MLTLTVDGGNLATVNANRRLRIMAYKHTNSKGITYYLHKTEVTLRGGKPQTIYFFAKVEKNPKGEACDLPDGRIVKENPRNGFLTVSRADKA